MKLQIPDGIKSSMFCILGMRWKKNTKKNYSKWMKMQMPGRSETDTKPHGANGLEIGLKTRKKKHGLHFHPVSIPLTRNK